jgi:4-aminobutyrate aminotransferase-like enzyme
VLVPPPGYLPGVRALCDKYGIVYIADEVMVGFGRVGEWFAFQAFDVVPDLITFAKGVNSGTCRSAASSSPTRSRAVSTRSPSRAGSPTRGIRWPAPRASRRSRCSHATASSSA